MFWADFCMCACTYNLNTYLYALLYMNSFPWGWELYSDDLYKVQRGLLNWILAATQQNYTVVKFYYYCYLLFVQTNYLNISLYSGVLLFFFNILSKWRKLFRFGWKLHKLCCSIFIFKTNCIILQQRKNHYIIYVSLFRG